LTEFGKAERAEKFTEQGKTETSLRLAMLRLPLDHRSRFLNFMLICTAVPGSCHHNIKKARSMEVLVTRGV